MTERIDRRYSLNAPIGSGPLGTVYQVQDALGSRTLALKRFVLPIDRLNVQSVQERLTAVTLAHTMQTLSRLRHPWLLEVLHYGYDHASATPSLFYTTDLLSDEPTLTEAVQGLSLEQKLRLIAEVLHVLVYLHRRGVLHRNLKPKNIRVADGHPRVMDSGLCMAIDPAQREQLPIAVLSALSPEQLEGQPASISSDLYALGLLLYEVIAGHFPYQRSSSKELISNILYFTPDTSALGLSPALAQVIVRLLSKQPHDRYQTALEALEALENASGLSLITLSENARDAYLRPSRLVGRDPELAHLTTALNTAFMGQGGAWTLSAESGIGKTRLLNEVRLLAMGQGAIVLTGGALEYGDTPYAVWRGITQWLALDPALSPSHQAALRVMTAQPGPDDADQTSDMLYEAFITALTHAIHERPVILLLEDLQWANLESLELWNHLGGLAATTRLLMIGTVRSDLAPSLIDQLRYTQQLALKRLPVRYISELTQQLLGPAGELPIVNALLYRETDGNAFFLLEVMRALAEQVGDLGMIGIKTLPEQLFVGGINEGVARRLDRMPQADQGLLSVMALAGNTIDTAVLHDLAPDRDIQAWLLEAHEACILEPHEGQWAFAHDRLWQGAAHRIAEADRPAIHARIAASLAAHHGDDSVHAAALAYHYGLGKDAAQERVYIDRAARLSRQSDALNDAIEQFERLLALTPQAEERPAILVMLAACYDRAGIESRALGLYTEAYTLARTYQLPHDEIEALFGLASAAREQGHLTEAREHLQAAQTLAAATTAQHQALALVGLGTLANDEGRPDEAIRYFEQALATGGLATAQRIGTLMAVGFHYHEREKAQKAARFLIEAFDLTHASDSYTAARAASALASAYLSGGDYAAARACLTYSVSVALEKNDRGGLVRDTGLMAYTDMRDGRFNDVERALQVTIRLARADSLAVLEATSIFHLGLFYLENGLLAEALERFEEAHIQVENTDAGRIRQEAVWLQAYVGGLLGINERDEAVEAIRRTLQADSPLSVRARADYWVWKTDPARVDAAEQAEQSLQAAYAETHEAQLSEYYTEITNQWPAVATALPALPATLIRPSLNLETLIARVEALTLSSGV